MMVSFTSQISFVFLFLLFATSFNGSICSRNTVVCCNDDDQRLLLIFKRGVVDPENQLSTWTSEEDCCSWEGVQCNNISRRVTELHLISYALQGEINLCVLLQLEFLNYLDLSFNNFTTMSFPPCQVTKYPPNTHRYDNQTFANPSKQSVKISAALRHLDFSYNDHLLINDLHWLSQLSSLKYLDFSYTVIGNETKWLQYMAMLPSLSELHLRVCGLRDFPSLNYANFTSLKILDLLGNVIHSKLHDSFFNFTNEISYVDLSNNSFYGEVSMHLLKLQNLEYLSLSGNQLNGSIPEWFGQNKHLQHLEISSNLLSGSIPTSLGNLSSLIFLDLSKNQLSGNLPESLGQLLSLNYLGIDSNALAGVLSEKNFANLSKLTDLYLKSNDFKFVFDLTWVPPFQLESLDLGNTSLGPNIPAWLYTQQSLNSLYIDGCGISTIDVDVFWSFVAGIDYTVDLSDNFISGDISNVTLNSAYINLRSNNFTGALPHLSTNVSFLEASHNSFSGSISTWLCHPKRTEESMLLSLDIQYNQLSGALPDCWVNYSKQLEYVYLGSNKLTGEIPSSMASLMNLRMLDLRDNSFYGKFSLDLSNWTKLEYLFLEGNRFSGSLPNKLNQTNLIVIKLRANKFIGHIPTQLCNLSSLRVLDLANNKLSGPIPHCLYNIMHSLPSFCQDEVMNLFTKGRELYYHQDCLLLHSIDLSSNNLSGEIPKELFRLTQMWSLNLSRNHLTGKISKEIGGVKTLEILDLSYNKLSGEIPPTISNLSFLDYLNLSYNNFVGQIPLGTQIQSFDSWSFVGNPELCGDPLPKKCKKKEETHNLRLANGNVYDDFLKSLYLGMGVGFAVGFWGVCGSLFLIRAWRHKFFRWFDHLADQLYVTVAIKFKRFH